MPTSSSLTKTECTSGQLEFHGLVRRAAVGQFVDGKISSDGGEGLHEDPNYVYVPNPGLNPGCVCDCEKCVLDTEYPESAQKV